MKLNIVMAGGPDAVPGCSKEAGIHAAEATDGSRTWHPWKRSRRQDQGGGVCLQGACYKRFSYSSHAYHQLRGLRGFWVPARMKHNALRLPRTFCWVSWGWTCWSLSWTSWGEAEEAPPGNRATPAMLPSVYLILGRTLKWCTHITGCLIHCLPSQWTSSR